MIVFVREKGDKYYFLTSYEFIIRAGTNQPLLHMPQLACYYSLVHIHSIIVNSHYMLPGNHSISH